MTDTALFIPGQPLIISSTSLEAEKLLGSEIKRVAIELGRSIAAQPFKLGMGVTLPPEACMAAADKIVGRFRNMAIAALDGEKAIADLEMLDWQTIDTAPLDGTPVDLWAEGKRWTDFHYVSKGVKGWQRKEGFPVTYRRLLVLPTHWRRIIAPPGVEASIDATAPESAP